MAAFPAIVFSVKRGEKSQKSLENMEKQTVFSVITSSNQVRMKQNLKSFDTLDLADGPMVIL